MKKNVALHTLLLLLTSTAPAYAQTSGNPNPYPLLLIIFGAVAIRPIYRLEAYYWNVRSDQGLQPNPSPMHQAWATLALTYLAAFIAPNIVWGAFTRIGGPYDWADTRTVLYASYTYLFGPILACQFQHWAIRAQKKFFLSRPLLGGVLTQVLIYFYPLQVFNMCVRSLSIYEPPDPFITHSTGDFSLIHPGLSTLFEALIYLLVMCGILAIQPVRYLWKHRGLATEQTTRDYWRVAAWAWLGLLAIGYAFMFIRVLLVYRVLG